MTVYLVELEPVETRYTAQWQTHIPKLLEDNGHFIQRVTCYDPIPAAVTPGAFLNFGGTNVFKAEQVKKIGKLFCGGWIQPGDHFLFYDAWHPGIINLKYMSELLQIPVTIHGLWHAGSYDPQDFLGRLIGDKPWVRHTEQAFFHAIDYNYFATDFHIKMFIDNLLQPTKHKGHEHCFHPIGNNVVRSGWPMEYMDQTLAPYKGLQKRDLILFPHRIAPEKQVEIFRDLAEHLPQYEFVVCQDQNLSKHEYHTLLGEAKIVFSANLQETLGISCYEGVIVNAIPMVPNRLSYKEMYLDAFKYPSHWTESFKAYEANRSQLCHEIIQHIEFYDSKKETLERQRSFLKNNFFSANALLRNLNE